MRRTTRFGQAEMGSEERKWGRQGGAESGPERLFRGGYRECKGTNHGQGDDEEGLSAGMGACETLTGEASRLKDETGQARASGEDEICDRRADRSGSAQFPTPRQNDDTASPPTKNKLRRRFLGSSGSPSSPRSTAHNCPVLSPTARLSTSPSVLRHYSRRFPCPCRPRRQLLAPWEVLRLQRPRPLQQTCTAFAYLTFFYQRLSTCTLLHQ